LINKELKKYVELYTAIQYENKKSHQQYKHNMIEKNEKGIIDFLKDWIINE